MPQWEAPQKKQPIKQVKQFGTGLKELGEHYGIRNLIQFSKQLLEHLDHLDITGIRGTLESFPKLVQQIKSIK